MSNDWKVLFNSERKEWIACEITGLLSSGESKRFNSEQKKDAIEYAKSMAGNNNVHVNHSTESIDEQWKKANESVRLFQLKNNGYYPINQPGWLGQTKY